MTTLMMMLLAMIAGPDAPQPSTTPAGAAGLHAAPADTGSSAWATVPLPPVVPQPDFQTPVDYLAWYQQAVAYAANDNALTRYGVFFYGDNGANAVTLAPAPDSPAALDLAKLLESPAPWYPAEKRELITWMQGVEVRFAHVVLGGKEHEFYATRLDPKCPLLVDQTPPALGNARTIGQILIARAWRVEDDTIDAERLSEALAANLILARQIGQGATLEEQFFAAGHRALVYRHIRRALYSLVHSAYQWSNVVQALEKYDNTSPPLELARGLYFAEAAALQLLQHMCTTIEADGKVTLAPKFNMDAVNAYAEQRYPGGRFRPAGIENLAGQDPRELAKAIHAYYEGMRGLLHQPVAGDLATKVDALEESTLNARPELGLIMTPIGLPVQASFRTEAERRLAYVFLKLAITFKFTGTWPDTLGGLDGARIAESRIDPFSGKDLLLRKVFEAYVPYSVGPDGIDNGGNEELDIVYWGRVSDEAYRHREAAASSNGLSADAGSNGAAPDASSNGADRPDTAPSLDLNTAGAPSSLP